MDYMNDVIVWVHVLCDRLISTLYVEGRLKDTLWVVFAEKIVSLYKQATQQVSFILWAERGGHLMRTNHYFSENLEKGSCSKIERDRGGVTRPSLRNLISSRGEDEGQYGARTRDRQLET
jgi:hypothetical protein